MSYGGRNEPDYIQAEHANRKIICYLDYFLIYFINILARLTLISL